MWYQVLHYCASVHKGVRDATDKIALLSGQGSGQCPDLSHELLDPVTKRFIVGSSLSGAAGPTTYHSGVLPEELRKILHAYAVRLDRGQRKHLAEARQLPARP